MTPDALWLMFMQTGDPVAYMLYKEATGGTPPIVGGLQSFNQSAYQATAQSGGETKPSPNPAPGDILPQTAAD